MAHLDQKRYVTETFYAAVKAVDAFESVRSYTDSIHKMYESDHFKRYSVIGFGEAACPMAKAIEDSLPDLIKTGIVITKYGHCSSTDKYINPRSMPFSNPPLPPFLKGGLLSEKIKIIEAGHPVPDEKGLRATEEIVKLVSRADEETLIVCLISGSGSALLVSPYEGITLNEKQKVTELLLKAGASIDELNTVRKHISKVKGGRLAEFAYPAKIISFLLSDVIGDRLDVIASGPTSPDRTTLELLLIETLSQKQKLSDLILRNF